MFTNLFPTQLSKTIKRIFSTIPNPPILLKLMPATQDGESCVKTTPPYAFLCQNERDRLKKYTLAKRQSEYLTGRICAKISTMSYLQSCGQHCAAMEQIEIINAESGYPFVKINPESLAPIPKISLSHSKEYALALAAQYRCGVDIQRQEKTLKKLQEKYCTDGEFSVLLKTLSKGNVLPGLTLLWSAKEAIQKSLSADVMPYFSEIRLQQCKKIEKNNVVLTFSLLTDRNPKWPRGITVAAGIFKNYAMAVTTLEGDC